jgi:hypothetical protein
MIYKNIEKHGFFVIQIPPAPPEKENTILKDGVFAFYRTKESFEQLYGNMPPVQTLVATFIFIHSGTDITQFLLW